MYINIFLYLYKVNKHKQTLKNKNTMKTLAQKRQAKKEQLNQEAKIQAKICFFSVTLIIGVILYAAITNGISVDNTAFSF